MNACYFSSFRQLYKITAFTSAGESLTGNIHMKLFKLTSVIFKHGARQSDWR